MKQVLRRLSAAVALCGLCGAGGLFATSAWAGSAIRTSSFAYDPSSGLQIQDVLDREIASNTQGFDGSTIRVSQQYDLFGRVE